MLILLKWLRRQDRHILLFCDNAPSHKHNKDEYSNIRIEPMIPNVTAWLQPMDGGIIASFKAQYRRRFIRHALYQNEQGASVENMYKINQLDGMRLALAAWDAVTPQTIHNCWRHVGIVPSTLPFYGPPPPAPYGFANQDPMYGYPEPAQHAGDEYNPLFHFSLEDAAVLDQLDMNFETEGVWSDAEIAALYAPST